MVLRQEEHGPPKVLTRNRGIRTVLTLDSRQIHRIVVTMVQTRVEAEFRTGRRIYRLMVVVNTTYTYIVLAANKRQ